MRVGLAARSGRVAEVSLAFLLALRLAIPDEAAGRGMETFVAALAPATLLLVCALGAAQGSMAPIGRWGWPFAALGLWTLVACSWAPESYDAAKVALHRVSDACFVGLGLVACSQGRGARRRLALILLTLGVMSAAYAVLQWAWILPGNRVAFEEQALIERVAPEERSALLSRLHSRRAAGTFSIPNTLAALLLLTLPTAIFMTLRHRGRRRLASGLALGLLLLGLAASGSKGGILIAAAVGVGTVWQHLPGRRWRALTGMAALAIVAAALVAPGVRDALRESFAVRMGYFGTTVSAWVEAPLAGIGPGQLEDAFFRLKPPEVEETRHAHNTYLQTATEVGAIGLALFVIAWWWPLLARLRGCRDAEDPGKDDHSCWGVGLAMIGGLLAAIVLGGAMPAGIGHGVGVGWLVRLALLAVAALACGALARSTLDPAWLAWGCAALLVHAAIDLDLEVPGMSAIGAAAVALCAPAVSRVPRELRGWLRGAVIISGLVLTLLLLRGVAVQDVLADLGRGEFLEATPPTATSRALQLDERLRRCLQAQQHMPIDPALALRASRLLSQLAHAPGELRQGVVIADSLDQLRRARRLDPLSAGLAMELGTALAREGARTDDPAMLVEALDHVDRAVAGYPANPRYQLILARMLIDAGRGREAGRHYSAAIECDSRLYERNRPRLGLSEAERAEAQRWAE